MPNINEMLLKMEFFSMVFHLIQTRGVILSSLDKTQITCVQLFSFGEIFLQTSTNGSYQLTKHFPTENEWFISWILIYPCVHKWPFGINKRIM